MYKHTQQLIKELQIEFSILNSDLISQNLMNFKTLFFVITISFFNSCSSPKDGEKIAKIDIRGTPSMLSDIIEDVSYVKLETNDSSLIGWIDNIQVLQDKFFVLDQSSKKAVFVFSNTGKFLLKIDQVNDLGFRFKYPTSVQAIPNQENILILDPNLFSISKYKLDGTFVKEFSLEKPPVNFIVLDSNRFLFGYGESTFSNSRLQIVDNDFKTLEKYLIKDSNRQSLGVSMSLDRNFISYIPAMSNRIYSIDENGVTESVTLDFGLQWPDEAEIQKIISHKHPGWFEIFTKKYPWILIHLETREHFALAFKFDDIKSTFFINKRSVKVIGSKRYIDDLGLGDIVNIKGVEGDYFLSVLDPHDLLESSTKYSNNEKLIEIIKALNPEDNAVLMKFKLK